MKNTFIQITRHLDGEPHTLNLVILASNGIASGGLEFYTSTVAVRQLGESLEGFPLNSRSTYLFEKGSERREDNRTNYFRFRAYAKNDLSRCAIQLRMNNNQPPNIVRPASKIYEFAPQLTDFEINIDGESLQNLGRKLIEFSKLAKQRLFWSPTVCLIDNELPFLDRRAGNNMEAALAALP